LIAVIGPITKRNKLHAQTGGQQLCDARWFL
jgi:hypothetical protein